MPPAPALSQQALYQLTMETTGCLLGRARSCSKEEPLGEEGASQSEGCCGLSLRCEGFEKAHTAWNPSKAATRMAEGAASLASRTARGTGRPLEQPRGLAGWPGRPSGCFAFSTGRGLPLTPELGGAHGGAGVTVLSPGK